MAETAKRLELVDLPAALAPREEPHDDALVVALAERVRRLRRQAGLTLVELALHSGVSRAMLSKVERGEKSPTLAIIGRIARGLNVTVTALLGGAQASGDLAIIKPHQRQTYTDPGTGFQRQLLSPAQLETGVELILHRIPPGQSSGALCTYKTPTDKYLVVHEGRLTVRIGEARHVLETGDSLYFEIKTPYRFDNEGEVACAYYLVTVRKG